LEGVAQSKAFILSVFSATVKYMVVKTTRSSFDVVLRTTKHIVIYPGSGPCSEIIVLRPTV
jgi:hypothetical protein